MNAHELIDDLIAQTTDWRGAVLATLRAVMHAADPEIVEEWKWRGAPTFSHNGIVCVVTLLKGKVKVTFADGAGLADPDGLFNAGLDGNRWRAIDIREGDVIDEGALAGLVRAGVARNLVKGKSGVKRVASATNRDDCTR